MSRGWIFDLDGTLVDSLPGIAASLNAALASQGQLTHTSEKVRTFIGDGAEMLVRRALIYACDENVFHGVLENFRDHYAAHWHEGTVPYAGIYELLASLRARGDCLAVLSNKPHSFTMSIVDHLFPETFSLVIGQRTGIPHKPDPAGLWEILRSPAWTATQSAMIGDSIMDLQTAKNAGIDAIAVGWGYHDLEALEKENPTALVNTVEELDELLRS